MRKKIYRSVFIATLAVCIHGGVGCTSTVYVVDLTPTDKGMRRTFTVDEVTGNNRHARQVRSADRDRLVDAYGLNLNDDEPLPQKLSSVFVGRMPEDVGGFGAYHQLESPYGVARFYTERFRGSLDLTDTLQRRQKSLNDAIDLVKQWSQHQWPTQDGVPQDGGDIASWVDTTFRNDLHNLLLVTWTHSAANEIVQGNGDLTKSISSTYFAYLGQYAAEHDYLQWNEMPLLFHAVNSQNNQAVSKIIHGILVRKLQQATGRDFRDELQIVLKPDELKMSLQGFLKSTDQYAALVQERQPITDESDSDAVEVDAVEVDPLDLITLPLWEAFVPGYVWARDRVEVQLHLNATPDHTNGTWDVQDQSVQWSRALNSGSMPTLAFAIWTEPNANFQDSVFGETKVNGDTLVMHSTWFTSLDEPDRQRWRQFLEAFVKQREQEPERSAKEVFEDLMDEANLADAPSLMTGAEQTQELL